MSFNEFDSNFSTDFSSSSDLCSDNESLLDNNFYLEKGAEPVFLTRRELIPYESASVTVDNTALYINEPRNCFYSGAESFLEQFDNETGLSINDPKNDFYSGNDVSNGEKVPGSLLDLLNYQEGLGDKGAFSTLGEGDFLTNSTLSNKPNLPDNQLSDIPVLSSPNSINFWFFGDEYMFKIWSLIDTIIRPENSINNPGLRNQTTNTSGDTTRAKQGSSTQTTVRSSSTSKPLSSEPPVDSGAGGAGGEPPRRPVTELIKPHAVEEGNFLEELIKLILKNEDLPDALVDSMLQNADDFGWVEGRIHLKRKGQLQMSRNRLDGLSAILRLNVDGKTRFYRKDREGLYVYRENEDKEVSRTNGRPTTRYQIYDDLVTGRRVPRSQSSRGGSASRSAVFSRPPSSLGASDFTEVYAPSGTTAGEVIDSSAIPVGHPLQDIPSSSANPPDYSQFRGPHYNNMTRQAAIYEAGLMAGANLARYLQQHSASQLGSAQSNPPDTPTIKVEANADNTQKQDTVVKQDTKADQKVEQKIEKNRGSSSLTTVAGAMISLALAASTGGASSMVTRTVASKPFEGKTKREATNRGRQDARDTVTRHRASQMFPPSKVPMADDTPIVDNQRLPDLKKESQPSYQKWRKSGYDSEMLHYKRQNPKARIPASSDFQEDLENSNPFAAPDLAIALAAALFDAVRRGWILRLFTKGKKDKK